MAYLIMPKELAKILAQVNTDNVLATFLLNSSGGILAYVGYTTEVDPRVMAAVANNITYLFERTTRWTFDGENVDMIIVACEKGSLAIAQVASFYVGCYGQSPLCLGMLKAKVEATVDALQELLLEVDNVSSRRPSINQD